MPDLIQCKIAKLWQVIRHTDSGCSVVQMQVARNRLYQDQLINRKIVKNMKPGKKIIVHETIIVEFYAQFCNL